MSRREVVHLRATPWLSAGVVTDKAFDSKPCAPTGTVPQEALQTQPELELEGEPTPLLQPFVPSASGSDTQY